MALARIKIIDSSKSFVFYSHRLQVDRWGGQLAFEERWKSNFLSFFFEKCVHKFPLNDEKHRKMSLPSNAGALCFVHGGWPENESDEQKKEAGQEKQIQADLDDQEKDERNGRRRKKADTVPRLSSGIRSDGLQ